MSQAVGFPKNKRPRHNIRMATEPIECNTDDENSVKYTPERKPRDSVEHEPHTSTARYFAEAIDATDPKYKRRKTVESSPDELAPTASDLAHKQQSKRRFDAMPNKTKLTSKSDIVPTKFTSLPVHNPRNTKKKDEQLRAHADHQARVRLRVLAGASGNNAYEESEAGSSDACFLADKDLSYVCVPVNQAGGNLEDYAYLRVDLDNAHSILVDTNDNFIQIKRERADPSHGCGALLVLKLSSEDRDSFVEWARNVKSRKKSDFTIDCRIS